MISQVVKVADDYVKSKTGNNGRAASITSTRKPDPDEVGQLKDFL